jgi:hypothetical protein
MFAHQRLHRQRFIYCGQPMDIGNNKATLFPVFLMIIRYCKTNRQNIALILGAEATLATRLLSTNNVTFPRVIHNGGGHLVESREHGYSPH